jgi:hypothetical protein
LRWRPRPKLGCGAKERRKLYIKLYENFNIPAKLLASATNKYFDQ